MRLISCYIENFGRLSNLSMDFEDGVNVICQNNGWGKSTFAAFLRAMFYGLHGDRKRDIQINERKKYMPWQGGVFGGHLVIAVGDKTYQITRIFHDKENSDEFELRDYTTNLISDDFSAEIGKELFGIDRESFMRTVFIGQGDCKTIATDDVNMMIGNITDNTNDMNNYDSANKTLEQIQNALTPNRVTGSIKKRGIRINELEQLMRQEDDVNASLNQSREGIKKLKSTIEEKKYNLEELREKQEKLSVAQGLLAKKEEWERIKKNLQEKKDAVEKVRIKFPGEIPDEAEVITMSQVCFELEKIQQRMDFNHLSMEEKVDWELLQIHFIAGVPTQEEVAEKIAEAIAYSEGEQQAKGKQLQPEEEARYQELSARYDQEDNMAQKMVGIWNERNNKKALLAANEASAANLRSGIEAQNSSNTSNNKLIFAAAGVSSLALSLFLFFAVSNVLGVVCLIATILVTAGVAGKKSSPKEDPRLDQLMELEKNIARDKEFIAQVDGEIKQYLEKHGKAFEEYGVAGNLQEIALEYAEYQNLLKRATSAREAMENEELQRTEQALRDYLKEYGYEAGPEQFVETLYQMQGDCGKYEMVLEKNTELEKAKEEYTLIEDAVVGFLNQHDFVPQEELGEQILMIQDMLFEYQGAVTSYENDLKVLKEFEEQCDVAQLEGVSEQEDNQTLRQVNDSIAVENQELEFLLEEMQRSNKDMEVLLEKYEQLQDYKEELNKLQELQMVEEAKYKYISLAKDKLALAKERITSKYAEPIKEGFKAYYKEINEAMEDNFLVDAHSNVTVQEYGKQRKVETLSAGCQDLVYVCLRAALADAMYQEERPVLVLDDPFAQLDDDKLSHIKDFLKKLGENYQIIYCTCSATRNVL